MEDYESYVMLIDLDSCSGCHACSVACKAENRPPDGTFRTKVQTAVGGIFPNVSKQFVPTLCQHCEDAPCIVACPTSAIDHNDQGIVVVRDDLCIGTGICVEACPYGAIIFNEEKGLAEKCDFCEGRLADGESPACVSTCPTDAFHFGLNSDPLIQSLLQNAAYSGSTSQWELEESRPHIFYKGLKKETLAALSRINPLGTE
ncbi:MAG TPA: 4Fe-4S dicluster domain-containing protein [Candidatus Angelobacter sp.]|nr:4Fe-4S dicluster domain-containing protein [Candidatus Angelobacter sp.]